MRERLTAARSRIVRALLVRWARGARARPRTDDRVYILLGNAWGMGGTIRTVLSLAGELANRHEVEILSLVRRRDDPFFEHPPGVTVTALDDQRPGASSRTARALRRRPSVLVTSGDRRATRLASLWSDLRLVRALRSRRDGVLIGTRPALNLIAAHAGSPSLVKVGQEHLNFATHRKPLRKAMRAGYPKLDALAVLTDHDLAAYRKAFPNGPRLECIPNAVPAYDGPPSDVSSKAVIAAGRLTSQKGFDRLIPAWAEVARRHPDWTLTIAGEGSERTALEALVREHGLRGSVSLPGRVKGLLERMAGSSIYVLSSRFEGFPMVLLEAMGAGLPVVAFDCPTGPREIVESRANGLLVPDGDVAALAAAIAELIEDDELRLRCAAGARRTAEAYSLEVIGARWSALFGELASS